MTHDTTGDGDRYAQDTAPYLPSGPSRRGVLSASAAAGLGLFATACGASQAAGAQEGKGKGKGEEKGKGAGHRKRRPHPRPELPRGGRELFPKHRLVGYCGSPGATALGRLGIGDPDKRAKEITKTADDYAHGREPLPVLELLATITNPNSGPDGTYRTRTDSDTIADFHKVARAHDAMLLLNIQPGRAKPLDEVKALHKWLLEPDVGIALDPEWEMGPGEVPGETFGRTSGPELSKVGDYMSGVVREHDLPEKPLIFHQVAPSVLHDEHKLRPAPGVPVIKSADGLGSADLKRDTWDRLVRHLPHGVHTGFKLFYDEDTRDGGKLMSPKDVLKLRPRPEYVMYE